MSTSAFAPALGLDPDDPRLTQKIQKLYSPKSERATIIHQDSRMAQKAYDYDYCGKMAQTMGCSRHLKVKPLKRRLQTCKQRFTTCCSPRIFKERMEKHEEVIELISTMKPDDWTGEFPTSIHVVNIHKPCVLPSGKWDGVGALALAKTVRDVLRKLAHDGEYKKDAMSENYYVKVAFQGFVGDNAIIQAIYWGPHYAPAEIRQALLARLRPNADIAVRTEPNTQAEAIFRGLFHIIVPESEREQAELEIMFHQKDFIFYSQRLDPEAFTSSFPCVDNQGNELSSDVPDDQNSDDCVVSMLPICPDCNHQADVISGLHPIDATVFEIIDGPWSKIFKSRH